MSKQDLSNEGAGLSTVTQDSTKFLDCEIRLNSTGQKIAVKKTGEDFCVTLNIEKFADRDSAIQAGVLKVVELKQTSAFIQEDPKTALETLQKHPNYRGILKLQGLKNHNSQIPELKAPESLPEQFDFACQYYALHGQMPKGLDEEVVKTFKSLPKSKRKLSVLDELLSDEYNPDANLKFFAHLEKARLSLKKIADTKKFEYKPQIGAGEQEPLNPEDIETRVTPFFGGYYRGHVCEYDPAQKKIIQKDGIASSFEEEIEGKEYLYETVFDPAKDNLLELPYGALPHSPEPKDFHFLKNESGSFYISAKKDQPKTKIKFKFVLIDAKLTDEPQELPQFTGEFDGATDTFLNTLDGLSKTQKAEKCAEYVRKRFKYPEDETKRAEMNEIYLNAGEDFLQVVATHGITDCYWSNIFHGQMLAKLGISHRLIAGHFVSKDPRFDFAAVAGIGHAWGEIWNGIEWVRKDATPAKEKSEEQEEGESAEGDFGESATPEEQEELSIDEIQRLFEEMLKKELKEENPAKVEFEKKTGVTLEKWNEVEDFIKNVNKMPIGNSTVAKEWENLFDTIYKKREIPYQSYRGPVRQSEGDELDDPVDAVIDILSGESDPMGYKIHHQKTREQVFVTEFEDDAILDLTGSMTGSPAEEQKKMILSGLYNLMNLNRRLGLDTYKHKMKEQVHLRSHILSFKGDKLVSALQNPADEINEKSLAFLYDELDKTQTGGGNLLGALKAYESTLDSRTDEKITKSKLVKILTIISDGGVPEKPEAIEIISRLRARGIIIQGIGFGNAAQDIRVICHHEKNPEAGVVITDVAQAVLVRQKMLKESLKGL